MLECLNDVEILLAEVKMAQNFVQNVNSVVSHYQRICDMPR